MAWPGLEDSDLESDSGSDVLGVSGTWVLDSPETEAAWMLLPWSLMTVDSSEPEVTWILLLCSLIVV